MNFFSLHCKSQYKLISVNPGTRWVHTKTVERFQGDLKNHISGRGKGLKIEQNVYRYLFLKLNKFHFLLLQNRKSFPYEEKEDELKKL